MALVNGNSLFKASRRKTKAYKDYPKNVRESLNIHDIHENGIFRLEPDGGNCLYDRCYAFEDINYMNQDDYEKRGILELLMQWLNSMKADFKICLSNEYRDMDQFLSEVLQEKNEEQYPEIAEGISQWIQKKLDEGSPNIRKVRYLIVTCRANGFEDAQVYFNTLETQLKRLFKSWKSRIYRLSAEQRLRTLHGFFRMGKNDVQSLDADQPGDWKNRVLPSHIDSYSNFMVMDGMYLSVMFGYNFAATVDESKLIHGLTNVSFPSMVTLDYAPVKKKILKGKLENAHMNNEKAIGDELDRKRQKGQYGTGVSYQKEKRKQELESYQDQIDENNEEGFFLGVLLVVTADSEEQLAQRVNQMKGVGEEEGITLEIYNHRQLKALNTALPFGGRQVDHMRPFLTSSAVALHPYHAQDVQEPGGICYGANRTTHRLIIGDRKKLPNPHGIIVGHSGAGKGMLVKATELSQSLLRYDDDIMLLDPQNEYIDLVMESGGEFFDLTPKSSMYLNSFEIPQEVFGGSELMKDKFVGDQTEFANALLIAIMKNIQVTQEHESVNSRCVRRMYKAAFEQKRLKKQPTLCLLREEIRKEMEQATNEDDQKICRQIYNSLQEYTEGAYDMFAHESNVSVSKRLSAFGLKNVGKSMWEVAMIAVMHYLSNRMEYNQKLQKATRLLIDEAQVVCDHPTSADILLQAVLTYRKFGGIVTLCLQNVSRALENEKMRDIFSNCSYKCFLDQGGVDAAALAEIQELSAAEFQSLNEDTPGYGVMIWNKKVILFDAFMERDNVLYEKFSTNYHEKAAQNEARQSQQSEALALVLPLGQNPSAESKRAELKRQQKEKIMQMAGLTPVTAAEVAMVLELDKQEAQALLDEMTVEAGLLCRTSTGIRQYSRAG